MLHVYSYKDPTNNEIFYIGKGSLTRTKRHLKRSHSDLVNKRITYIREQGYEPIVELVHSSTDEDEILELEEFLISEIGKVSEGKGTLLNIASKGVNSSEITLTKDQVKLLGTDTDRNIGNLIGVHWSTVRQKRQDLEIKSYKFVHQGTQGWSSKWLVSDGTVYTLYDTNGSDYKGTRKDLCDKLNIDNMRLGELLRGNAKNVKGYFLEPQKDRVTQTTVFIFKNKNGETFKGNYKEFSDKYNEKFRSVRNMCTGHRAFFKDWTCVRCKKEDL